MFFGGKGKVDANVFRSLRESCASRARSLYNRHRMTAIGCDLMVERGVFESQGATPEHCTLRFRDSHFVGVIVVDGGRERPTKSCHDFTIAWHDSARVCHAFAKSWHDFLKSWHDFLETWHDFVKSWHKKHLMSKGLNEPFKTWWSHYGKAL